MAAPAVRLVDLHFSPVAARADVPALGRLAGWLSGVICVAALSAFMLAMQATANPVPAPGALFSVLRI